MKLPVNLAYSRRNRSAACRIPMYSASPKAKRVEFRPPDPSANPYLAFSAMMMAGVDGVLSKVDPGEPLDKDIYDLSPEEMKNVPSMPASLDEALTCLEDDHGFLLKGDVFTRGADRNLHRLQAQERGGRHPAPAAPLRVRVVLRHLGNCSLTAAARCHSLWLSRVLQICGLYPKTAHTKTIVNRSSTSATARNSSLRTGGEVLAAGPPLKIEGRIRR